MGNLYSEKAQSIQTSTMATLYISLPDDLLNFLQGRADLSGYASVEEYVVSLLQTECKRWKSLTDEEIDALLLEGLKIIEEEGTVEDTDEFWIQLQDRIKAGEFAKKKPTNDSNAAD